VHWHLSCPDCRALTGVDDKVGAVIALGSCGRSKSQAAACADFGMQEDGQAPIRQREHDSYAGASRIR
jgi:hypothetical protein